MPSFMSTGGKKKVLCVFCVLLVAFHCLRGLFKYYSVSAAHEKSKSTRSSKLSSTILNN